MQEWINSLLNTQEIGIALFLGAFFLGLFSSVASGCNIAAIGAIAGYSGTRESKNKADILYTSIGFIIGTMLALVIIGFLIGYIGQVTNNYIQSAGKFIAGIVLVFFGLVTLNLFPIKMPTFKVSNTMNNSGIVGDVLFGFALGGSTLSCTITCCSPILPIVMGMAAIKGQAFESALLLGVFGIGHLIPLLAILMGFSFGKFAIGTGKSLTIIKKISGVLLICIGFYFLITL